MIEWILNLLQKLGFSLMAISIIIVLISIFGVIDFEKALVVNGLVIPLDKAAAIYLGLHFLAENYFKRSVLPTLHPETVCAVPTCRSKNVGIIKGEIKCYKCGNVYSINSKILK